MQCFITKLVALISYCCLFWHRRKLRLYRVLCFYLLSLLFLPTFCGTGIERKSDKKFKGSKILSLLFALTQKVSANWRTRRFDPQDSSRSKFSSDESPVGRACYSKGL